MRPLILVAPRRIGIFVYVRKVDLLTRLRNVLVLMMIFVVLLIMRTARMLVRTLWILIWTRHVNKVRNLLILLSLILVIMWMCRSVCRWVRLNRRWTRRFMVMVHGARLIGCTRFLIRFLRSICVPNSRRRVLRLLVRRRRIS